jgi:hypothetical protein
VKEREKKKAKVNDEQDYESDEELFFVGTL